MPLILTIFLLLFVLGFSIAMFVNSEGDWIMIVIGVMALVFFVFMLLFVTSDPPLFSCPGCGVFCWSPGLHCDACGYELFPCCVECGEICRTAFCSACGAEQ